MKPNATSLPLMLGMLPDKAPKRELEVARKRLREALDEN
jgi:hypothetical protein